MPGTKDKDFSSLVLDQEEKEFLHSFENDEWQTVQNTQEERAQAIKAAKLCLQKDARINIRLSNRDLNRIKQKAAYQVSFINIQLDILISDLRKIYKILKTLFIPLHCA